jgi:hypothetical protein
MNKLENQKNYNDMSSNHVNLNDIENNEEKNVIWFKNVNFLFKYDNLLDLWPMEHMSREEKFNAITRLVILMTILGFFLFKSIKILITGIITILNKKKVENFSSEDIYEKLKIHYTNPTSKNPLMNILPTENKDYPYRQQAAPSYNKAVNDEINETAKEFIKNNFDDIDIEEKLFNNLGNFEFNQSMRQFYTTANTNIPNNQKEFAKFCYGNMASCKDGDVEMCLKNNPRTINM